MGAAPRDPAFRGGSQEHVRVSLENWRADKAQRLADLKAWRNQVMAETIGGIASPIGQATSPTPHLHPAKKMLATVEEMAAAFGVDVVTFRKIVGVMAFNKPISDAVHQRVNHTRLYDRNLNDDEPREGVNKPADPGLMDQLSKVDPEKLKAFLAAQGG